METNKIYLGDCYELIKQIPDKSVDLIVTDPPYEIECEGSNNNLGVSMKSGMINELKNSDIVTGINFEILDEFMRVMKKPNIYIWCNKKQVLDYLNYFVG
jgi:DNA modification methylase